MNTYLDILNKYHLEPTNPSLFEEAFTHSSYVHEHEECKDYERIEFVGDGVLDLVVAIIIFTEYPALDQGIMTKLRASIVCGSSLARYARKLNMGSMIRLGKGEETSNGRDSNKILEDVFEAFIGACYLNFGYEVVFNIVYDIMYDDIKHVDLDTITDYKSKLQEYVQADRRGTIVYKVIREEGSPQNKKFFVEAIYENMILGFGEGSSKKKAEQEAARDALKKRAK